MSAAEIAYKSTAPEVLAAWEHRCARAKEFSESVRAFAEARGCKAMVTTWSSGRRLAGLVPDDANKPEGPWRFGKHIGCWVPDKRTREGKALAAELKEFQIGSLRDLPGMPTEAMAGGRWHSPGVERHGDCVWVTWGCSHEQVLGTEWSKTKLDSSLWEQAPLSAYYLARENDPEYAS